jgi:hypothetical protein
MADVNDLQSAGVEAYASAAKENGHQVTAVQSILYGFDGRNTDTGNEAYIYVFDKATAPVSGTDTPRIVIEVGAAGTGGAGNFFYNVVTYGEKFKKGIYILGCSTDFNGNSFTALSSSKLFFHVQFAYEDGTTNPA